jgi:hypothetical protein
MLGASKENKQSLQGQLSTSQLARWHKKKVSTLLMDHFQGDTKKLG